MMRKLAITAAAVAISVGSTLMGWTLSASAMHGGHMHGGHSGGHFGHHAFFGHPFHHHFGRSFFFADVPSTYDDDACYMRVWTRSGWRWRSICF